VGTHRRRSIYISDMLLDGFLGVEAATTSSSQSELLCACDVTVEGPAAVERQAIAATAIIEIFWDTTCPLWRLWLAATQGNGAGAREGLVRTDGLLSRKCHMLLS